MSEKTAISGIVGNALREYADWFLYIFIDANANLPADIMTKRKNQLWWLTAIADVDIFYDFNQCVDLVKDGIIAKYHKQPHEVLQQMFNVAMFVNNPQVSGIGKLVPGTDIEYTDPSLINPITLKPYTSVSQISLTTYDKSGAVAPKKSTFWADLGTVTTWLVGVINQILGGTRNINNGTASYNDWSSLNGNNSTVSSITTYLPYVAGAAIIYFLVTNNSKEKK